MFVKINLLGFCIFNCVITIPVKCRFWFSKMQKRNLKLLKLVFKITNLSIESVKRNLPKAQNQVLKVPLSYLSHRKSAKNSFKSDDIKNKSTLLEHGLDTFGT